MKTQQDIHALFSMFHDFELESIQFNKPLLKLTLGIPWSELEEANIPARIELNLHGCESVLCTYLVKTSNRMIRNETENKYADTEEITTTSTKEIERARLLIQSFEFHSDDRYTFHCGGQHVIYGQINITVTGFELYDPSGKPISLDQMKEWGKKWWDGFFD